MDRSITIFQLAVNRYIVIFFFTYHSHNAKNICSSQLRPSPLLSTTMTLTLLLPLPLSPAISEGYSILGAGAEVPLRATLPRTSVSTYA